MLEGLVKLIADYHIGDFASIIGLLLAVVGFILTFREARKAKSAAQSAQLEVQKLRNMLLQVNTIADLATAMSAMEEIKRLQRLEAWHILPDRYSAVRRMLNTIRSANPNLTDKHKDALFDTIQQLSIIERKIERILAKGRGSLDQARFNTIVSVQMDKLEEVLTVMRQNIGA